MAITIIPKIMIRFLSRIVALLVKNYNRLYNYLSLKHNRISFTKKPIINGRLLIRNGGTIILGDGVVFNNSTKYNTIGLFKQCSIAVRPNAMLTIGDGTGLSGVSIYCANRIDIGSNVTIGGNVCIWDSDFHPIDYSDRISNKINKIASGPITIKNGAFIGANSIILKNVVIGEQSIIGAGSVVTKSIPPKEIWAGNPAKMVRKIE